MSEEVPRYKAIGSAVGFGPIFLFSYYYETFEYKVISLFFSTLLMGGGNRECVMRNDNLHSFRDVEESGLPSWSCSGLRKFMPHLN